MYSNSYMQADITYLINIFWGRNSELSFRFNILTQNYFFITTLNIYTIMLNHNITIGKFQKPRIVFFCKKLKNKQVKKCIIVYWIEWCMLDKKIIVCDSTFRCKIWHTTSSTTPRPYDGSLSVLACSWLIGGMKVQVLKAP